MNSKCKYLNVENEKKKCTRQTMGELPQNRKGHSPYNIKIKQLIKKKSIIQLYKK